MKRITTFIAGIMLALGVSLAAAPAASAGGSGDFYYQRYSPYVCGFRISATNYDNSTGGQTYHFALQSLPSGYTPNYWTWNGGSATFKGYHGGYQNYSTKSTDHSIRVYVNTPSGGSCTTSIAASAWS